MKKRPSIAALNSGLGRIAFVDWLMVAEIASD
jgi:hypothetical protein